MKTILRNTWAVLGKKEKKHFSFLILLDIVISIVDILSLVVLLLIIQFYVQPGNINRLSAFLPDWLADRNSAWLITVFFLLFGLKNLAGYFISRAHYRFFGRVAIRISQTNLQRYQQASYDEFVTVDSSAQIRKIGFQPFEFCQYILSGIQQVITQSFLISIAIIAILLFNTKLFLLLLAILLPPVIGIYFFIRKRLDKARKKIRSGNERSFQYLLDALKGYVESNIYDRNDFFMRRFIHSRQQFSKALFESISIQNMPSRFIEIFAILGLFVLIALAKWTGNNDNAYLITIGAFMAAAYKIIPGIVKIMNASGQMRAYEFSLADLGQPGIPGKEKPPSATSEIIHSAELRNINFRYAEQPVLAGLSFTMKSGDFIGITGQSGKGKTTILNLLLGFLTPGSGQILVNDRPANTGELRNYWPFVSYVRQQPFFIYDTILQNITLEEKDHDEQALQYALDVSGLSEFLSKFPEGIQKIITENGKNISGGQQQRVSLARALYKKADLILLDEPFNELDEASVLSLLGHFRELVSQNKIVVMITHDKKSLSYCNKIISLDEQG